MVVFDAIRPHFQQNVLQKLDFVDFSRFSKCSLYSKTMSECFKRRLPCSIVNVYLEEEEITFETWGSNTELPVSRILDQFPIRLHTEEIRSWGEFSKERWNQIIQLFENGKIKALRMELYRIGGDWMDEISPEAFNHLLKVSKVQILDCNAIFSSDYLLQPELQKIPYFKLETIAHEGYPFEIFLGFKAHLLFLKPILLSSQSANQFFKQWCNGTRTIDSIELSCTSEIGIDQDEAIFSGIPHEVILPQNILTQEFMEKVGDDDHFQETRSFALKRGNEQLLVKIRGNKVWADMTNDPVEDV